MATVVGGICRVKINSNTYPLRGNVTVRGLSRNYEQIIGRDGRVHGALERPKLVTADVTLSGIQESGITFQMIENLGNNVDDSISFESNEGRILLLEDITVSNDVPRDVIDNMLEITVESARLTEVVSS